MSTQLKLTARSYSVEHTDANGVMYTGEVSLREGMTTLYLKTQDPTLEVSVYIYTTGVKEYRITGEEASSAIMATVEQILQDVKLSLSTDEA